jgi:hypothetical protein
MGKDRRSQRKRCQRCTQWAEYGAELCSDCEQDALESVRDDATEGWDFHGGISAEALRATHGGYPVSGTWVYDDPLDQERADSLEGGE